MRPRGASPLAWSLWALFFPLAAATKYLESPAGELFGSFVESVALLGAFAVFATVGALIASRRPRNPIGWLLLAVALGTVFTAFADAYANYGLILHPGSLPGVWVMAWFQSWTWYPSVGLMLTFVILLFPTGRLPSPRWKPLGWADAVLIASMTLPTALAPRIELGGEADAQRLVADNPIGVEAAGSVLPVVEAVTGIGGIVLIALGLASVFVRYRRAEHEERQQVKWFLYAAALVVAGMVVGELAPEWGGGNVLFALLVSLIPISIAVAVLKHRLYEIDVVINKTLVYGGLAGFITLVYVAIVVGIGAIVGAGDEPNLGLQVAATALVAFLFQPVRERTQRIANRVVYGKRATPYEVVSTLASRLSEVPAVEEVLPRMAEAAARGVGAVRAMVRLFLPTGDSQTVVWPEDAPSEGWDAQLDVAHASQTIGRIAVAKSRGEALRPNERALLEDLAGQAGLALHNVRLNTELRAKLAEIRRQAEEIRESRRRLLSAQDEERRRLEREISRGVQRRLAGAESDLDSAAALVPVDADRAAKLLDDIGAATQRALEELRDLARGVFPPLLADKGIAAALDSYVAKSGAPVAVQVDDRLRDHRVDPDAEAAIYFCCVEAIVNSAGPVRIELSPDAEGLTFRVLGGTTPADSLLRMRDRLEALGGGLEIGADLVSGRVPARLIEAAT